MSEKFYNFLIWLWIILGLASIGFSTVWYWELGFFAIEFIDQRNSALVFIVLYAPIGVGIIVAYICLELINYSQKKRDELRSKYCHFICFKVLTNTILIILIVIIKIISKL